MPYTYTMLPAAPRSPARVPDNDGQQWFRFAVTGEQVHGLRDGQIRKTCGFVGLEVRRQFPRQAHV